MIPTRSRLRSEVTVAIIGAGLSGTLVAVHFLRRARAGTRVLLLDRNPELGRGVAYGTTCGGHLLNVPAARMSAFPDEPEHFLNWVRSHLGEEGFPTAVAPTTFLPRVLFGRYVDDVLREAAAATAPHVAFEIIRGEVVDLDEVATGVYLQLADGRNYEAQQVVLALGNLPGEYPIQKALRFYRSARYVHVPWAKGVLDDIGSDDAVLLVGAGLTSIDVMLQLKECGHRGTIHALSRRGLRPLVHQAGPAYRPFLAEGEPPSTIRSLVRRVREEIARAAAEGIGWRAVIDALRPNSQALWQALSWEERKRFLRHVRPYWEVHRHRLAPEVARQVEEMQAEGRLHFHAGRLQTLAETGNGVRAVFRRRGTGELVPVEVVKVVNCTGPRTDYSKYQHPLLVNLLARGLIDHDPLALGLNALPTGEVLRYRAGPSGWLFTLGAPLKGVLWESTAVPEIRQQAKALAERLLERTSRTSAA
jgi:uncharacterized NAD(P)/FAD-binding protein YdhS